MKSLRSLLLLAFLLAPLGAAPGCKALATNIKGTVCASESKFTDGWEKGIASLASITDGIFPPASIVVRFLGGSGSAVFRFVCGATGTVADAAGDAAAVVVDKPLTAAGLYVPPAPAPPAPAPAGTPPAGH